MWYYLLCVTFSPQQATESLKHPADSPFPIKFPLLWCILFHWVTSVQPGTVKPIYALVFTFTSLFLLAFPSCRLRWQLLRGTTSSRKADCLLLYLAAGLKVANRHMERTEASDLELKKICIEANLQHKSLEDLTLDMHKGYTSTAEF